MHSEIPALRQNRLAFFQTCLYGFFDVVLQTIQVALQLIFHLCECIIAVEFGDTRALVPITEAHKWVRILDFGIKMTVFDGALIRVDHELQLPITGPCQAMSTVNKHFVWLRKHAPFVVSVLKPLLVPNVDRDSCGAA